MTAFTFIATVLLCSEHYGLGALELKALRSISNSSKSQICSVENIFHGTWHYWKEPQTSYPDISDQRQMIEASYQQCPRTLKSITNSTLGYQPRDYSCDYRYIKPAQFTPHSCELLHEHKAVSELLRSVKTLPVQVKFIGDSIGAQTYIGMLCALEAKNLSNYFNVTYEVETRFRRDIPCEPNCTQPGTAGEEFRAKSKQLINNPCAGCKDGVRHSIDDPQNNEKWAEGLLNFETKIDFLVLNSGAWYSIFSYVVNSTQSYEVMLKHVLLPSLQTALERHPRMKVYWLDMPPFIATTNISTHFLDLYAETVSNASSSFRWSEALEIQRQREFFKNCRSKEGFEWNLMEEKNQLARKYLTPIGVHFLDTRPALLPRKQTDPMVSTDGLHWCNPGKYSVPGFVGKALLHLFAVNHLKDAARTIFLGE